MASRPSAFRLLVPDSRSLLSLVRMIKVGTDRFALSVPGFIWNDCLGRDIQVDATPAILVSHSTSALSARRPMEPHFDSGWGDVEHARDVPGVEVLYIAKDQHHPVSLRQLIQASAHKGKPLAAFMQLLNRISRAGFIRTIAAFVEARQQLLDRFLASAPA